jgi:hypothetical protein
MKALRLVEEPDLPIPSPTLVSVDEGDSLASGRAREEVDRQELAQADDDIVTPRGFTYERAPPELDPRKLNRPLPRAEQQQIATVLGKLLSGKFAELGLHRYDNMPHPATGAVLPPSTLGYLVVDVPNNDIDRGRYEAAHRPKHWAHVLYEQSLLELLSHSGESEAELTH